MGKTKRKSPDELESLKNGNGLFPKIDTSYVSNPLFLYEVDQLSDWNTTRSALFRRDFQHYLGLTQSLQEVLHIQPGVKMDNNTTQHTITQQKMDICHDKYLPLRQALMDIASNDKHLLWCIPSSQMAELILHLLNFSHGTPLLVTLDREF